MPGGHGWTELDLAGQRVTCTTRYPLTCRRVRWAQHQQRLQVPQPVDPLRAGHSAKYTCARESRPQQLCNMDRYSKHFATMNSVVEQTSENSRKACRETLRDSESEGTYWALMGGRPDRETEASTLRDLRWDIGTSPLVRRHENLEQSPIAAHAHFDLCVLRALSPVWNPRPSERRALDNLIRLAAEEDSSTAQMLADRNAHIEDYELTARIVAGRMAPLARPEEGVPLGDMPYMLMSGVACAHVESSRSGSTAPSLLLVLSYGLHARVQLLLANSSVAQVSDQYVKSVLGGWCAATSLAARREDGEERDLSHLEITIRAYLEAAGLYELSRLEFSERNRTLLRNSRSL